MKRWVRGIATILFILAMAGVAELTGEMEVLFPEALALAVGMWVADGKPWQVRSLQFLLLITGAAVAGVLLVRYVPVPLFVKAGIAFFIAAVLLCVARSTFFPILSACVLPVLLGTESLVYPLAVFVMAAVLVLMRLGFQKAGLLAQDTPVERGKPDYRQWAGLFLLFLLFAALPVHLGALYLIAPPLLVTFVEFAERSSSKRQAPARVWCVIVLCAVWGSGCRLVLAEAAGVPMALSAAAAAGMALVTFQCVRMTFPPASAVALLPFLLDAGTLWLYPLEIAAGAAVFIGMALLAFREKKQEAREEIGLEEEGSQ